FDHVFGCRRRSDENNGSGFIAENSGSPVIGISALLMYAAELQGPECINRLAQP
ncbi:hypothetical protein L9F63_011791, partial [Diploptera punctata]